MLNLNTILFNSTFNGRLKNAGKIALILPLLAVSQLASANTINTTISTENSKTFSVGQFKKTQTQSDVKNNKLLGKKANKIAAQQYQGMQREQVKLERKIQASQAIATVPKLLSRTKNQSTMNADVYYSFSIYTGYSELITDIDQDGYYQTFSVSFDADIISSAPGDQAMVYADLYLSDNGGPWVLYYTTDNFIINGENTDDEFEVVTRLESGYVPNNYDVLIDLYEVGYSDVVATYSADDTNELYALPLESVDYDPEYVEVVEIHQEHGGSTNGLCLALLSLLAIRRYAQL